MKRPQRPDRPKSAPTGTDGRSDTAFEDIAFFDFVLPRDNIAQHPSDPREAAHLLRIRTAPNGESARRELHRVANLPELLRGDDFLIFNDTRVLPAKLEARRIRDGRAARIGITLDREIATGSWKALVRNSRRLKIGDTLHFAYRDQIKDHAVSAEITDIEAGGNATLRFSSTGSDFPQFLHDVGELALPPYIRRPDGATAQDEKDYQTVFSRHLGAVAAPTAGLHFTDELLGKLAERGIKHEFVTLHVGAGTFLPVRDTIQEHVMHAERGDISARAAARINEARAQGKRIVCVGTTSLRLLESATDEHGITHPWRGETDIFIRPGHYEFRAADALITNFHLPKSTLFMLVCAFMGPEAMKDAYRFAVENGLRFYSYGDACLLERSVWTD